MNHPSSHRLRTALAVAALALFTLAPQEAAADQKLALRVNDARGGPGDLVAVVVRTYASRPIAQGQICIGVRRSGRNRSTARSTANAATGEAAAAGSPFASLEKVEVFSARQDATFQVSFDGQGADVTFRSPSSSINAVDGPLAVFYFRLSNSVKDREVYDIDLDIADTFIIAGSGERLQIEPKPGELEIREDDDDDDDDGEDTEARLSAIGGRVRAGKVARVKLATGDPIALSSGRIALRYDPKVVAGKPWVRVEPRYKATVLVNADVPGLVVINFQSPDRSLNRLPGDLLEVRMSISRQAPRGRSPVTIDPGLTVLRDRDGDQLDLTIQNGALTIR
ncbi:MAG TPA: hypothetical protein VN493_03650 [Thermoanaerobaculia bacterium]|nr:hypothetical protein [Thermoanaerobaculia bacterium]